MDMNFLEIKKLNADFPKATVTASPGKKVSATAKSSRPNDRPLSATENEMSVHKMTIPSLCHNILITLVIPCSFPATPPEKTQRKNAEDERITQLPEITVAPNVSSNVDVEASDNRVDIERLPNTFPISSTSQFVDSFFHSYLNSLIY